jgi:hypothetical protein
MPAAEKVETAKAAYHLLTFVRRTAGHGNK